MEHCSRQSVVLVWVPSRRCAPAQRTKLEGKGLGMLGRREESAGLLYVIATHAGPKLALRSGATDIVTCSAIQLFH